MKFSVATPVFNGMPHLPCCVASVRDQAGRIDTRTGATLRAQLRTGGTDCIEIEHLVQDGGSTDGTIEWLQNQCELKWKSEEDAGMYDAINRAWRRSSGDIYSWLNADEQYLPETLRKVARVFAVNPEVDIIFGDALLARPDGKLLSYRRVVKPRRAHTRVVHLGTLSCATFFRRRLLEEGYYLDTSWRAIGDAEWIYRLLERPACLRVMSEPLSIFTMTGRNLGATAVSRAEGHLWKKSAPRLWRWCAPLLKVLHRVEKAAAGAYTKRKIEALLFTPTYTDKRLRVTATKLGSHWKDD